MNPLDYQIEPLSNSDRHDVVAIFNYFIESTFAAFPDEPVPDAFFDRLLAMCSGYPALVAKADRKTVGFAFLRPYHPANTLRRTAEIAYFLRPEHAGILRRR